MREQYSLFLETWSVSSYLKCMQWMKYDSFSRVFGMREFLERESSDNDTQWKYQIV